MDPNYQEESKLYQTNNYSIKSKFSAVDRGYFKDEYLKYFVEKEEKSWRRTPLVNRGYASRLWAMDWSIERAIKYNKVDCFIIFGAGYDTLALRWLDRFKSGITFIEVDLPEIIVNKASKLQDNELVDKLEKDPNGGCYHSKFYHLLTCDLRNHDKLKRVLEETLGCLHYRNVCIINEVCFCYLERQDIVQILQTTNDVLNAQAHKILYIGFEQVNPVINSLSSFSRVMLDHFRSLSYPLRYYPDARDIQDIFKDVLQYDHVSTLSMYQFYHNILVNELFGDSLDHLEPFDEFEELDLFLAHYSLVTAIKTIRGHHMISVAMHDKAENDSNTITTLEEDKEALNYRIKPCRYYTRYGHASCPIESSDNLLIIYGGFGYSDMSSSQLDTEEYPARENTHNKHKRLDDFLLVDLCDPTARPGIAKISTNLVREKLGGRMHSKMVNISGTNFLMISGGRQSPTRSPCDTLLLKIDTHSDSGDHQIDMIDCGISEQSAWRHEICALPDQSIIQLGGLTNNSYGPACVVWKFDSNRIQPLKRDLGESFKNRHSFATCVFSNNNIVVFGGLTTTKYCDHVGNHGAYPPVDLNDSIQVIDFRQKDAISFSMKDNEEINYSYYSSTIHTVSDNQFIIIGGISTSSGNCDNTVLNYDLRNERFIRRFRISSSSSESCRYLLHNHVSAAKDGSILTFGGGSGSYFTFGSSFNKSVISISER